MDETIDTDELPLVVDRARTHDPDAWEQLYRHCRPKLFRYARRRLATDHAADDAVSEAMLRAMDRIEQFVWKGAGFDAWMYGITRNVVLETHRRTARDQRLDQKQAGTLGLVDLRHGRPVGEGLEIDEERQLLARAFELLNETDQEILELRVVGGLSAEEVAVVLDKNPGAVRMAQSRALERLRKAMKELEGV